MFKLREYQQDAIDMTRHSLASGKKRPLLQLPTGAGKTLIASKMITMALAKGNKCLFTVDALSLVDQTVDKFYRAGLRDMGVIQADHPMTDWSKPIQIASVQTLQRRGFPKFSFGIIDECHTRRDWLHEKMASGDLADVPIIGLTATPWSRGLGHVFDDLLIPATMNTLITQGYLSEYRVFAPHHPDLSGVKIQAGDYRIRELAKIMNGEKLIADIVSTWKRLAEWRPTICFCVDRAHAKKIQMQFEEAGVPCGYIDAYTPVDEREQIRRKVERGALKVVTNVGCLIKGVDWQVSCIIFACPTRSKIKFVQAAGRGFRVNPGTEDCLILDHSDNTLRLGLPADIGQDALCTAKKGERQAQDKISLPKECPKCSYIKAPKVHECPCCGFKPVVRSLIDAGAGRLTEVKNTIVPRVTRQLWYSSLLWIENKQHYKKGWASITFKEKFGDWPRGLTPQPTDAPQEILSYVRSRMIRHAYRQKKSARAQQ